MIVTYKVTAIQLAPASIWSKKQFAVPRLALPGHLECDSLTFVWKVSGCVILRNYLITKRTGGTVVSLINQDCILWSFIRNRTNNDFPKQYSNDKYIRRGAISSSDRFQMIEITYQVRIWFDIGLLHHSHKQRHFWLNFLDKCNYFCLLLFGYIALRW